MRIIEIRFWICLGKSRMEEREARVRVMMMMMRGRRNDWRRWKRRRRRRMMMSNWRRRFHVVT